MATSHASLVRGVLGMEWLHFAAVLALMAAITYATMPESLVVKDPNVGHVWFYGWLAAITTGLGALPLLFFSSYSTYWFGVSNAVAAGMMLSASYSLIAEGIALDDDGIQVMVQGVNISHFLRVCLGFLLGMLFVRSTKSVLADFQDFRMGDIEGLQAKKMFIVIFVMAMHSFAEGLGIGVAFCGKSGAHTGVFIAATLAVHNMPEGLAVALVLVPRGVPKFYTFAMAILSSLPQPLIAVPVYLFVETFIAWESVGLGFAAGAMCWVACLELLPDAAKELSQPTCVGCLCAAFVAMMGISAWLDSATRNALATTAHEPGLAQSGLWNALFKTPEEIWGSRSGGEGGQVPTQHWHSVLAARMGFGSSAYVLPLIYSLLAGLSTGIGGFLCLPILGSATAEVPVTAFMLATAAAAMITVSGFDLFYKLVEEMGLKHTLLMSISGVLTVLATKKLGEYVFVPLRSPIKSSAAAKRQASERRLLRVGLLTAITLTAHNFPEGMAVAISTMSSVNLGLKLAVAIALHNIPEGLAIACPLIMSKTYSPAGAIGVAFASGLSEPVGALLTLLILQNIITQERIDYALAFVGGVMLAVAFCELLPESLRLQRTAMTCAGFMTGIAVMGLSLYFLE